MSKKISAEFGLWDAKITSQMLTQKARRFGTLKTSGEAVYWTEQRSDEAGRGVIMRWDEKQGITEILTAPHSARSKVHEYGGGEFCIAKDGIYFVNAENQQLYRCTSNSEPEQITNAPGVRFADLEYDALNDRLIAVAEHHETGANAQQTPKLPKNKLVYIGLKGEETGGITILDDAHDFYASPRLSPNQETLAWLQWDLPSMPWETASLQISPLNIGSFHPQYVAGGISPETNSASAAFGPVWDEAGTLYFISDISGTGQLYRWQQGEVSLVQHQDPKADSLRPQWVFAMESICTTQSGDLFLTSFREGLQSLQHITTKEIGQISTKAKSIDMPHICGQKLSAIVSTDKKPQAVSLIDPKTGELTILRESADFDVDAANISKGELLQFEGPQGPVFGLYYPPCHATQQGPIATSPPAIITVHGGPTAMADRGLKLKTQYWTNRGFAVFEIDYSGSSGYGKPYRERLNGKWGELDVEEIIAGAAFLVQQNKADPNKLIITGGSAGGYTALMALTKTDLFKCASVSYPVTDLGQLLEITHKFEAGYTYTLTDTTPENAKAKLAKSAVLSQDKNIKTPVIFFQGLDDKVVPIAQPKAVYEALIAEGTNAKMIEFAGEGHGFRKAETIIKLLKEEELFFQKALGLDT